MKYTSLFLFIVVAACGQQKKGDALKQVDVKSAASLKKENPDLVILDVRTPDETQSGVIEGAIILDYMKLDFDEKVARLDKNKPFLVYCATGYRE